MEDNKVEQKASQSFIEAAHEFENIERVLLYFRVSNTLINKNTSEALVNLKALNEKMEVPYGFDEGKEKQTLEVDYYHSTLSTMLYIKAIDNFQNYFKDILSEIMLCDPRVLKSQETETLEFILSFEDRESLVKAIAEKKIESMFYQNITAIQKFFEKKVRVKIFQEKTEAIDLLIKQRNLAVHNRSRISKQLVKQFPDSDFVEGRYLDFNFDYVQKIVSALYKMINELDTIFSTKYKIEQRAY